MSRRPNARLAPPPEGRGEGRRREEACVASMGRRLGLLEGPGVSTERAMTDDGPACRSSPSNGRLGSGGVRQARKAPQPVAGRQGRESEPDAGPGVAARAGLGERGRGGGRPGGLHRPLQLGPAALPCGGLPPMSRIYGVNNVMAHNS